MTESAGNQIPWPGKLARPGRENFTVYCWQLGDRPGPLGSLTGIEVIPRLLALLFGVARHRGPVAIHLDASRVTIRKAKKIGEGDQGDVIFSFERQGVFLTGVRYGRRWTSVFLSFPDGSGRGYEVRRGDADLLVGALSPRKRRP